jgi:hypothetical protein
MVCNRVWRVACGNHLCEEFNSQSDDCRSLSSFFSIIPFSKFRCGYVAHEVLM